LRQFPTKLLKFRFILVGQTQLAREQSVLQAVSAGGTLSGWRSWAGAALRMTCPPESSPA
jgi:hypothetical protein